MRGFIYLSLILSLIVIAIFMYALIFEYDLETYPSIEYAKAKEFFGQGNFDEILFDREHIEYSEKQAMWSNITGVAILMTMVILLMNIVVVNTDEFKEYRNEKYKKYKLILISLYFIGVLASYYLSKKPHLYMELFLPMAFALKLFIDYLEIFVNQRKFRKLSL